MIVKLTAPVDVITPDMVPVFAAAGDIYRIVGRCFFTDTLPPPLAWRELQAALGTALRAAHNLTEGDAICDPSTNDPECVERRQLRAMVLVKVVRGVESYGGMFTFSKGEVERERVLVMEYRRLTS